ncbi:TonB-dependent receptor [Sandaracinobacteroides sp. A072]|uniref:TonB-dependent receptor n=1 Tax=Sandaracinobacteroides sp. A072 TaxID=3461146 RepID=UPI004041E150
MMIRLYSGSALGALALSMAFGGSANAQSTGTMDFDSTIIVTGSRTSEGMAGVVLPDTTKAKAALDAEMIQRQRAGATILDTINLLPGVSFQNNDGYGSAGGTLSIRGFSADRISLTFDGIPLNDTGNYAIYSNQQLDPELIEQVNVNLGSTDVDSPTAAASGSTVNYRTRNPREDLGVQASLSVGEYGYWRVFGVIDTGVITSFGTRAYVSAARTKNEVPFNNIGMIDKQQYNAKIYQPIGDNGDFVAISGHYNQNRNNFFGSVALRKDRDVPSGFPETRDDRFYYVAACSTEVPATPGVADAANSCGSTFDERMNPSNTGNVRINSRFTLADGLVLTVDPSFQYVKANGGGTAVGREGLRDVAPGAAILELPGYLGGSPYFGRDLNGDGDLLDTVRVLAPSQTQTRRYGVIASLRYEFNDQHALRASYSWDYGRHRQTGQVGFLNNDGSAVDPFPVNDPLADVTGTVLQKRDRLSKAILNQVSGEYRGKFFDDAVTFTAGLRAPFFRRNLNNYCFTTSVTGFVDCFGDNPAANDAYAAANPAVQGPQQRVYNYDKLLPNLGFTVRATDNVTVFANYSKGLQVPGTDALYNAFFFSRDQEEAKPDPETTNNFDLGLRYSSSQFQAQVSGWFTRYQDRLASAYDPELDRSIYRNLGEVDKYGIDGSITYSPIRELVFYVFGSYLKSEIKEDVQLGPNSFAPTKGKRESGAPEYTFGGRVQGEIGPATLGVQAKRTGKRWINDQNLPLAVWGSATVPAYTLVDLDARISLDDVTFLRNSYFQLNITNVFDKLYVGGFGGNLSETAVPFVQIGAPRTISATVVVGF